jgi:hypothetical protein
MIIRETMPIATETIGSRTDECICAILGTIIPDLEIIGQERKIHVRLSNRPKIEIEDGLFIAYRRLGKSPGRNATACKSQ